MCDNYHGDALTTTREAWKSEIFIIKGVLVNYSDKNGQVIFEYDIPRLGKRIDVVLLIEGIVFYEESFMRTKEELFKGVPKKQLKTSLIQRKMQIGYGKASRIKDYLLGEN